jgi:hypothetical protein
MSEFTQKFLSILLLFVVGFVLLNIFTDVKDYFYTKQLGIFDKIFKNNIII